jgi:hypothetical protein
MEEIFENDLHYILVSQTGDIVGVQSLPTNPRPKKKRKLNPTGENMYLLSDGTIDKEEDRIVAAQRIWKERAYAPKTGVMYKKVLASFNLEQQSSGALLSCAQPSGEGAPLMRSGF